MLLSGSAYQVDGEGGGIQQKFEIQSLKCKKKNLKNFFYWKK